jgi:hypothetical protein
MIGAFAVMRGLDPRISSRMADGRVTPGHDGVCGFLVQPGSRRRQFSR